ncbi:ABC transporter permease [Pseudactinotalea terrae]|uniref:ABC transporter permease n=1 Tax=Pseudactinotalea terrae TaxID=1743262 RepID=UPI001F4F11CF|nr:ABC transporter permease [Pseudactinotalea terrae]
MVALLVTFLSMLTAGLARASTSAITDLPVDHLAFTTSEEGADPDVTSSRVTETEWEAWAKEPGVSAADPLGIVTTRATAETTTAVTTFGVDPGSALAPAGLADGEVVLTAGAADDLGIDVGGELILDGEAFQVSALAEEDLEYSHTPVVWMSLADWQAIGARGVADDGSVATVVALTTDGSVDLAAADAAIGTTTVSTHDARAAVSSFTAENTSLTTMQGFLMAISALVVGAFFTVWTIGRQGDIAVLKALGAPTGYLLLDAVGQAALLLVGGVAVGTGIAAGAATLLGGALPVLVSPATTLVPAAALVVLGLLGAGAAVMRITRTDPHAALASR